MLCCCMGAWSFNAMREIGSVNTLKICLQPLIASYLVESKNIGRAGATQRYSSGSRLMDEDGSVLGNRPI